MHQIQLADDVYDKVKLRADAEGFDSVDEYVVDMLLDDDYEETPNLDHLFTPERLAVLDQVSAEIAAGGKTYTLEEFSENLAQHRADWIRKNEK